MPRICCCIFGQILTIFGITWAYFNILENNSPEKQQFVYIFIYLSNERIVFGLANSRGLVSFGVYNGIYKF